MRKKLLVNPVLTDVEAERLLDNITEACQIWKWKKTRFGKQCMNDPGFVDKLIEGHKPRFDTMIKISTFIMDCNRLTPKERDKWKKRKSP